ncbi:hypothetical protein L3X38_044059 [Prunus dulcis]|uniref:GAG-pre-integrase domain-containing protein n=1 Tax=Prunus dulcis TaxID=3755 RepID=A0AAD4UYC4_PRUDU|nr:hypothetical protein L3X38_044059 [Prunus dulcis]
MEVLLEVTSLRRTGRKMGRIGITSPILIPNQMHQMKELKHPASTVKNCTMASAGLKENQNAEDVESLVTWLEIAMTINLCRSGCSNHMTGDERLLIDIRRDVTSKVKMGTRETVQVAGKGTLVIETKTGRKHIQEVMLVPGLEENLLSVGQMMEHGCFSLTMVPVTQLVLRASVTHNLQTWHKRLGHLNDQSIRMLANQDMVHGLPSLEKDLQFVKAASWESSIETHFLQNLLGELSFHLN